MRGDADDVFRRVYPRLVSIAARVLGSGSQAEDVAQDAFIQFLRSRVPADDAPGWLARATVHTALNHLRTDRRRVHRESQAAVHHVSATSPDAAEVAAERADRASVREVLSTLPHKQAAVLVLRHSGLSYQEISSAVGLSVGSVGTTLRRAEATMRKELTDHGPRL